MKNVWINLDTDDSVPSTSTEARQCRPLTVATMFSISSYFYGSFLNGPAGVMKGICTEISPEMMDRYRYCGVFM